MSKDQHQKQRDKSRSKAADSVSEDVADDRKTGKDVKKEKQGILLTYFTFCIKHHMLLNLISIIFFFLKSF